MSRAFNIPIFYKSDVVSIVKNYRRDTDRRKTDLTPSILKLSKVTFKIARHFGFCFGVENAIEIAYRAISENPDKRVFLLSEMIHNPKVNGDLIQRGVRFLLSPKGEELISFDLLTPEDIVIVPAFGTTVELFDRLKSKGIDPQVYNATCPFVERVWKRAAELGNKGFTIVIHGKHDHEETKATFSHARLTGPSVIIKDLNEAKELAEYITFKKPRSEFLKRFGSLCSDGFNPDIHLDKIGVVNQTTMLATETQTISDFLKDSLCSHFGQDNLSKHYADTRDTLCYATKENQDAMAGLIEAGGDLAVIVGGYNSSNTSHLVELCEKKYPTYYIKDSAEIIDKDKIRHLSLHTNSVIESINWLPEKINLEIMISAGASCPDALVDEVITKIASLLGVEQEIADSVNSLT
jgi:4-hydroxy-3-methylbut-2-enyl diphosphate reductase